MGRFARLGLSREALSYYHTPPRRPSSRASTKYCNPSDECGSPSPWVRAAYKASVEAYLNSVQDLPSNLLNLPRLKSANPSLSATAVGYRLSTRESFSKHTSRRRATVYPAVPMKSSTIINDGNIVVEATAKHTNGSTNGAPRSAILHRHIHHEPTMVKGASGNFLEVSDGRKIFDATGGAAVACLGHGNERVKEALIRQMDEVSYCASLFFSHQAGEDLGELLISSTGGRMARAFIISSGKRSKSNFIGFVLT
jgi:hypothetical protein